MCSLLPKDLTIQNLSSLQVLLCPVVKVQIIFSGSLGSLISFVPGSIHRYPIFSTKYSVMCKVYTGYDGTSEIEHGLCACTVDNPLAKARGLSLRTGAQTMLYLSLRVILKLEFCLQAFGEGEGAWLKLHFTGHEETPLNRACYFHFLCVFFISEGFTAHNTFLCVFPWSLFLSVFFFQILHSHSPTVCTSKHGSKHSSDVSSTGDVTNRHSLVTKRQRDPCDRHRRIRG